MLSQDRKQRGALTIHVKEHPKLGRHRTLLVLARRLVEAALEMREVRRVHFGHILQVWPEDRAELSHKVLIKWQPDAAYIHLAVADTDVAQIFPIYLWHSDQESISAVIQCLERVAKRYGLECMRY